MKKIYSLLTLALFAVIVSCTDDDLDPLNFKKVTKGTLLALRGDFLQAIYIDGTSGASFVPLITDGTDVFSFDAEYLSDDPTSLESIDVYVENADGVRTLLENIPATAFKTTDDYTRPWVTVSFTLNEILAGLDLPQASPDEPLPQETVDLLLDEYGAGINIVTDLNLKDGTKVLADEMVAAGLYQSDQFYPAMRLPFDVVKYCPYEEGEWSGDYKALEIGEETVGPYVVKFTQTGDHTYEVSNILDTDNPNTPLVDESFHIVITLNPSTSPYDQEVTVETVTFGTGDDATDFEAEGTYQQCPVLNDDGTKKDDGTILLDVVYGDYEFTYQFKKVVTP